MSKIKLGDKVTFGFAGSFISGIVIESPYLLAGRKCITAECLIDKTKYPVPVTECTKLDDNG